VKPEQLQYANYLVNRLMELKKVRDHYRPDVHALSVRFSTDGAHAHLHGRNIKYLHGPQFILSDSILSRMLNDAIEHVEKELTALGVDV
jgi:hypothetical protein